MKSFMSSLSFFSPAIIHSRTASIRRFTQRALLLLGLFGMAEMGWGQTAIAISSFPWIQTTSAPFTNSATLPTCFNIYTTNALSGSASAVSTTAPATNATGQSYVWYSGTASNSCIGWIFSSGFKPSSPTIVFSFKNTTGSTITSLNVSVDYKKLRQGTTSETYTLTGSSGSVPASLNYTYAADGSVATMAFPGTSVTNTGTITGLSIANNATYSLTWTVSGANSSSHATGIGNIMLSLPPSITGAATSTAFTTIYGSASAVQSFPVSGSNLTADLVANAPTGFEVSADGTTYGSSATFTQSAGTASGSLRIRLSATATVGGTYNSKNIVLSSTGAASVNITTAASGNSVSAKALTITGLTGNNKVYDGTTTATLSGTAAYSGLVNSESFSVTGTPSFSFATAAVGTGKPITVTGYTAPSSNYSLTQPTGLSANITAKSLTVTGASASNKTYDGTTTATIAGTLSGVIAGDNVTFSGTGTFASSNVGTGISVTSTSNIVGTNSGNYTLTQPTGLSANITKKNLTITGLSGIDKVYDGLNSATATGTAVLSGVIGSDDVTLGGTPVFTFSSASVGTAISITTTGYSISGAQSSNYSLTQPTLSANITASALTITANGASKTYGQVVSYGSGSTAFSSSGLQNGETIGSVTITANGGAAANAAVGSYTLTPSAAAGGSFSAGNYSITYVGGTLSVTAAPLTITANDITKTFGATLTGGAGSTAFTSSGLQNAETIASVTIAYGTGSSADDAAGTYPGQVTPSAAVGGSFVSSNYNITYVNGTITVTSSPAIAGAATATPFTTTYGTASSAQAFTISGSALTADIVATAPSGYEVSSDGTSYGATATFAQASGSVSGTLYIRIAAATVPGSYNSLNIVLSSAGATSVNISTPASGNTVSQKALTVTGATTANKIYDGTNTASINGGTLVGIVGSDNVTLTLSGTFAQTNVGTNIPITSTSAIGGTNASYYTLTQPVLTARNITAKELTISGATTSDKIYDGTNAATVTGGSLVGVISPDVVTLTQSGTFVQSSVGNGIVVTSTSTIGGANSGNYTLTQPTGLSANITAKSLTVTGASASNKTYDGTTTATIAGTLSGVIAGDVVTFSGTGTFASSNVGTGISVTSTSTIVGANSGNYTLTQPTGLSANITAKSLTITGASASNKTYDGTNAATVSGGSLVGVISPDVVTLTQSGTFAQSSVGNGIAVTSTSTIGGSNSGNYTLTQPTGLSANITAKSLTITGASASNKTYDGTNVATVTGGSLVGVISPDVVTLTQSGTFAQSSVGNGIVVTSTSTIGGANSGNYTLTQPTGLSANITQAGQTITFGALSNVTTATADYSPGASASSGLSVTYVSSNLSVATIVSGNIHIVGAGTTNITASQAGNANYAAAADVVQTLTVTAAPVTLYFEDFGVNTAATYSSANTPGSANLNSHLSAPSWSQNLTSGGFGGFTGTGDGCFSATTGTSAYTVTSSFNVNNGYILTPSSVAFANRGSSTGPNALTISISGTGGSTSVSPTPSRTGAFTTTSSTNFSNTSLNLTGTITLSLAFTGGSANSTERLDNVYLYGNVFCATPAAPTVSNSTVTYNGTAISVTAATTPIAGTTPTVDWYTAATGGTAVLPGSLTSPTNINAGTYTYYAEAKNTVCGAVSSTRTQVTITINKATPTLSISNSPVTYNGSGQSASVSGTGGGAVSNILYNGSATVPTNVGTYTVTADIAASANYNAATGASAGSFVITPATPTVTVTVGTYTYTASAQGPTAVSGNTGNGTVTWSYVGVSGTSYGPSATLPTNAGSYTATASVAANGNYGTATSSATPFTIAQKTLTVTATNQSKCQGVTLSLGTSLFTTSGLVGSSDAVSSVTLASTGSASNAVAGSYDILPSAASGSGLANYLISYNSGSLTVNALPTAVTVTGGGAICSGSSTTLNASNASSGTIYWQGTTSGGTSTATAATSQSVSAAGTYYFRAQSTQGCWGTEGSATITVDPTSVGGTVAGSATVCSGTNSTTLTLSGNTGSVTRWESSLDNFATAAVSISNTTTTLTASNLTATTYYRAVVTSGVCSSANSGVVTVTVTTAPSAGSITGTQDICTNGSTTFTSNGDNGGTWTSGTQAVATVNGSTGAVTPVSSGTSTITYTVTGTGGCSNTTASATSTVTVTAAPNAGTITGTSTICQGSTAQLQSNGNAGGTWTSSNTNVATVSSSGIITGLSAGTSSIIYTVAGTGPCSSALTSITAAVNGTPATPVVSVANACGQSTLSFTPATNATILWSNNATTASTTTSSNTPLTVVQIVNGCTSAAGSGTPAPIAIPTPLSLTGTNCAADGFGSIVSSTSQSNVTYQLSNTDGTVGSIVTGTGSQIVWPNLANANAYAVLGTLGNCTSTSNLVNVTTGTGAIAYYGNLDGDAQYSNTPVYFCSGMQPATGYVTSAGTDCNDNNASIYLYANEICGNNIDENCTGATDDTPAFYKSAVATGDWGNASTWVVSCTSNGTYTPAAYSPPSGYTGNVNILNGHSIKIPADGTVYQTGTLDIDAGGTLTLVGNAAINNPSNTTANGGEIPNNVAKLTVTVNVNIDSDGINGAGVLNIGHQASLVQTATTAGTGNTGGGIINIETKLTGTNTAGAPNGRYWYIGSPMNNTSAAQFFDTPSMVRLWNYNALNNSWGVVIHSTSSPTVTTTKKLVPGIGYLYRAGLNKTITYTGSSATLNNNIETNLLSPASDVNYVDVTSYNTVGYKYVANPYPSYIDWLSVTRSGLNVSYWLRNSANTAYDAYNATTGVSSSTTGQTTRYIAPMQGFWVYAFTASPAPLLRIDNTDRVHSTNVLHAPVTSQVVRLKLNNGASSDYTVVYENELASNDFEETDTDKMFDYDFHQLYTLEGEHELSLNGLLNATAKGSVDMGMVVPNNGAYTLEATDLGVEEAVILEDKFNHTFQDLKVNPIYSFSSNAGTFNNRFVLHFTTTETVGVGETETVADAVRVFNTSNKQVKVWVSNTAEYQGATVKVYDAIGNLVERKNMTSNELLLDLDIANGIYVVEVTGKTEVFTKKIFILK